MGSGKLVDETTNVFSDPIAFSKHLLKFNPYPYQERILTACVTKKKVAAICARQSGKSTIVAIFCLFWAFTIPNQQVILVSPTQKQTSWLFDKIRGHIMDSAYLQSQIVENYKTKITWKNGSQIHALTVGAKGKSLRGGTANVLVMEESAFIKDSIVNSVIMPMLSSTIKTGGTIIQISTPIGRNHFWRATQPKSNYEVIHVTYQDCIDVGQYDKEFIEEQKQALNPDEFAREYMAVFTESEGAALPFNVISPCIYPDLKLQGSASNINPKGYKEYYLGLDIGRFGSKTAMVLLGKDVNDVLNVIMIMELKKASFQTQLYYIKHIFNRINISKCGVDATGMGIPFYENLKIEFAKHHIIPVNFNTQTKQQMMKSFRELIRERRIRLPDDKRLITQIIEQEYKINSQGNEIYDPPQGVHDDIFWGLLIACYIEGKRAPISYVRVN